MKTRLSQFCYELTRIVDPWSAPLDNVLRCLGDGSESRPVFETVPSLREAQHKLSLLTEKLRNEQAFVIIFGPLKSGKSTLMNAMTGEYVSEVTALPAYPCLVYVSDQDRPEYRVTCYDGHVEAMESADELRDYVKLAHAALSERIREVEGCSRSGTGKAVSNPAATESPESSHPTEIAAPTHSGLLEFDDAETTLSTQPDNPADHHAVGDSLGSTDQRENGTSPSPGSSAEAAEQKREKFDPGIHYPRALRKIDVKIRAGDLRESGAVLVDTPGLYTRMKFGYDQMTREFRDTAACAVFVVKTDNLFLEQVFEEFHELLDIFGKIFLVVNLDSTKQDLSPDGSLRPSLESENPASIIEAFENLAMSAEVKQAKESGRIRVFPVDLLRAGSRRLQQRQGIPESDLEASQTGFEAFRRELTDYLNSTDYFETFIDDSLRYGESLAQEIAELSTHRTVIELRNRLSALQHESQDLEETRAALLEILEFEWREMFKKLLETLTLKTQEATENDSSYLGQLQQVVLDWYQRTDSFQDLTHGRFAEFQAQIRAELEGQVVALFEELVGATENSPSWHSQEVARQVLPQSIREAAERTKLPLNRAFEEAIKEARSVPAEGGAALEMSLDDIPIKKAVLDRFLFRSEHRVRHRIFGPDTAPDRLIEVPVKSRALGEEGVEAITQRAKQQLSAELARLKIALPKRYVSAFSRRFTESFGKEVREQYERVAAKLDRATSLKGQLETISTLFQELESQSNSGSAALAKLRNDYESGEAELGEELLDSIESSV